MFFMTCKQFSLFNYLFSCVLLGILLFTSSCGKNEATGRTFGTAAGALVGAATAGRHNTAAGAVIGGLLGNVVCGAVGQAADEDERESEDRVKEHHRAVALRALERNRQENRHLKEKLTKWCIDCGKEISIAEAQCCPSCGGELIREKLCERCKTSFDPRSGYRYCPYCKNGVKLAAR